MTKHYHDRHWDHFGRLVWTPTSEEFKKMYVDDQDSENHDPGDEDRTEKPTLRPYSQGKPRAP